ncbi:MAG: 16S rRNA (cytidine(1402)-2'-O)-methyltransferase [Crocinitomicaceae bacterium TMED114]|nr:MAG: 16S rRNA (cytidine(1402)-2'-O)-methyltransferase [Crocinitomicaceae bacterium TMED114]
MLTVVPTPIGNLGDFTPRAIEAIEGADFVLAEDTRTTGSLLRLKGVEARLRPFHAHNEHKVLEEVVSSLAAGAKACLCSDAGTPGISDPGFLLVRACVEAGVDVTCLPGATAFVPALVVSGLPCERFVYEGFLPHKKGRQTRLKGIAAETRTTVLYESPHRMVKLLGELVEHCGPERKASVSRELSKKFEETRRGTVQELLAHFEAHAPKGEFVVVVAGAD